MRLELILKHTAFYAFLKILFACVSIIPRGMESVVPSGFNENEVSW